MTQTDLNDLPLAVYRTRPEGVILAEIEGGEYKAGADGQPEVVTPPLVVKFRVPTATDAATVEARCRESMLQLMQGRGAQTRYGLDPSAIDEQTLAGLSPFIAAVESATLLVQDWNYGRAGADGRPPEKIPVSAEAIAELFRGRPLARAGWTLQYDTVSPLERAEGNGFAASPNTTSATAATTAGGASRSEAPAAGAAPAVQDDTAPAP